MESEKLEDGGPAFNVKGEREVEKGYPKYIAESDKADEGRVYINER